ncbi:MAG TPA: hypothetical protein DEF36_16680 [Desulfotomaculum sp.]|nr:hypothetical protein [Desulfotomaculum sp.]
MSYKSIGRQLQLAREQAGWSQEQMAAKIGCSQSTLSNYEKGKRRIYLAQLEKISEILNQPVEFFLRPAEYMPSPPNERAVGIVPEPEGSIRPPEGLPQDQIAERALLEHYRSLSAEGKKLALCFMEWAKKREVAGNG